MSEPLGGLQGQKLVQEVAAHMTGLLLHLLNKEGLPAFPGKLTDIQLLCDCNHIVHGVVAALRNEVKVPWDIVRYQERLGPKQTGRNEAKEEQMSKMFPPIFTGAAVPIITQPAIIVDKHGNILAWHLPGILSKERQDLTWTRFQTLQPALSVGQREGVKWRRKPELFHKGLQLREGEVNMSPAWHEVGKENQLPQISATLKKAGSPGRKWLTANERFAALCGGLLVIVHPEQFKLGMQAIERLSGDPGLTQKSADWEAVFKNWASPFNALTVISNRETPSHRDVGGRFEWFDILATLGTYEDAVLELPGVGIKLSYPPGSLVPIAGKVLIHKVDKVEGERVCVAWYMRDNVHHQLDIPTCSWPNICKYR